jgi:hypothetical protein
MFVFTTAYHVLTTAAGKNRKADFVLPPGVQMFDQIVPRKISNVSMTQQLEEPIVRQTGSASALATASISADQHHRQRRNGQHRFLNPPHHHPHHHNHHSHTLSPRPVEHDQHSAGSTSNDSGTTHTSGYQSGYQSGYATDDGTFEGKMLCRASRERPANLRMTAIRDYAPCCNEELPVRKGQRVKVLYKNNDWVYALTKSGEAGYIPYTYVRPSRKYAGYQSEPEAYETDVYQSGYDTDATIMSTRRRPQGYYRGQVGDMAPAYSVHTGFSPQPPHARNRLGSGSPHDSRRPHVSGYTSAIEYNPAESSYGHSRRYPRPARSLHNLVDTSRGSLSRSPRPTECKPAIDSFEKHFLEELVVIHDFEAKEEDEVFVAKGEKVRVLNAEDPLWLWIETTPGDEGFVPRTCLSLGNHPLLQGGRSRSGSRQEVRGGRHVRRYYQDHSVTSRQARAKQRFQELARLRNQNPVCMSKEEIKRIGSKLIVLMDYTATQDDELNIEFAEVLVADVLKQTGSERIWAYCPRLDACGYVPISLVVPPVV